MIDIKKIRIWDTKLKYIGNIGLLQSSIGKPWIVTEFAYTPSSVLFYIVQLLHDDGVTCGVSGFHCYAFTEQEFKDNFELFDK